MALVDYGTLPPIPSRDESGRLSAIRIGKVRDASLRTLAALAAANALLPPGTPLPDYAGLILARSEIQLPAAGDSSPRLVEYYIEATATPAQFGDVQCSMADSRAFKGTDTDGKITPATRFAREWVVHYIVSGDGTVSDTHWLAVNATLSFGSNTGYFTGGGIVRRGAGHSIISRTYNELPDKLVYMQPDRYSFPGTLGQDNGYPVAFPGATRTVNFEIEETYHLGEAAGSIIQYEPKKWAAGYMKFTGPEGPGSKGFSFPGVIGNTSLSGFNVYFGGMLCTTIVGTIASDPPNYPTGKKRISSKPTPWKGDIWKRTDVYLTF